MDTAETKGLGIEVSHPLERKLVALRSRVRQMATLYGLCVVATALLGTVAALGLLDYVLRFQDRGLRIMASLVMFGLWGWTLYRYVLTPLLVRLCDTDLALRVERHFPELGDRLVSAVEFLQSAEDDAAAGSAALRQAVVKQMAAESERLDFSAVLDRRPTIRIGALMIAVGLAVSLLVLLDPLASRIALARLVNPFGSVAWPQKIHSMPRPPVDPPAVESIAVRLIQPAYTGQPPKPGERAILALVGTTVQITGQASRPLRSAMLCMEEDSKTPVQLAEDGRGFTVAFTVEKSGSYWFELIDREGISGGGGDRWELRVLPDVPPTVSIERPTANLIVTPQAVAPLRVTARDDLAVARVALIFRRVELDSGGEKAMPLWSGGPNPQTDAEETLQVDYAWDLGLLDLKPGTRISFHATATDYRPQTGKSDSRNLTVVTVEQLQDRMADREKLILAELERALKIERGCRGQIESFGARLAKLRHLGQAEADQLQSLQHQQHEVNQILTSRGEGVPMHILALLDDLKINRLLSDDVHRRLSALLERINGLGREHLPAIGYALTAATKTAQVALAGQGGAAESERQIMPLLVAAGAHQEAVIAALKQMIGQVSRSDSCRRILREIGQLVRDQEEAARRTSTVGRRTLTQELRDLATQDSAELKDVAGRQFDLARLLDRMVQEMDQAGGELRQHDPSAARLIAAAMDAAIRLAISGQMRTVGERIEQNQIGQAVQGQKQIGRDLQKILEILANRGQEGDGRPLQTVRTSPATNDAPKAKKGDANGPQPSDQAAPSTAPGSTGPSKPHKPSMDETRATMRRLWGALPAQARQQMLQSPVEEFPPKYETMIEEYYRRLAEEEGKRGMLNDR